MSEAIRNVKRVLPELKAEARDRSKAEGSEIHRGSPAAHAIGAELICASKQ